MPSRGAPRRSYVKTKASYVRDGARQGRVTKRGISRGGSSTKTRRTPSHKPYTPVEYPRAKALYFAADKDWDPTKFVAGIQKLAFGDKFDIRDTHLDSIIQAGPAFCHSLQHFESGDSETGEGGPLSDTAVIQLAAACPFLVNAQLDASTRLTDASLVAFFSNCPNLCYLAVTGNDKVRGRVKGTAFDQLRETPEWGRKLEKIRLTDQNYLDKKFKDALRKLSAARMKLAIEVGETHPRHGSVDTWLAGKEKMGYQAFGGPGGFSQYGGW